MTAGLTPAVILFFPYIQNMNDTIRFAAVAVSGPMRRTFTYRLPPGLPELIGGQRLLVPFGRIRKIGFFLRYVPKPDFPGIKDIASILDERSPFSDELFRLCEWMAEYYFANPADCLSAALPPSLKTRLRANYTWSPTADTGSTSAVGELPPEVRKTVKPGRKLTQNTLRTIRAYRPALLARMVDQQLITESWPSEQTQSVGQIGGYRAINLEKWPAYYESKRFKPEIFDGARDRAELKANLWSDYAIRQAVKAELMLPIYREEPGSVLEFIEARRDLHDIELTDEQSSAVETIRPLLDSGFQTFLLHGVTGSGKTMVYCRLGHEVINMGKTMLVLTPEIALTGTTLAYFRGFFGDLVTVIHSSMTARERLTSWQGLKSGKYKIAVGPRSALFAPLPDLGLIVVDEEHDGSYKQDDPAPRFQGRDCAIMRGKLNRIPVILGSASPSMESYHHARSGRYRLIEMKMRPAGASLPTVHVVDMKTDRLKGDLSYLSYSLKKQTGETLERGEQVILYLNRRGYAPHLKCPECGYVPTCPHCDMRLTYHKVGRRLSCHYCGHVCPQFDICPDCGSHDILYRGVGTQRVEENLPRLFAKAKPLRLDSDSAFGRRKAYEILSNLASGKSNLLLGTQMVTKGLDLPNVTLVGVLSADASLDLPDFRASEKAFAKLLQVSGRCGRADKPGRVLIQTYYPESDIIADSAAQDYESFFNREIDSRKMAMYPPFSRLVNFVLSGKDEKRLISVAEKFGDELRLRIKEAGLSAQLLGPAQCPLHLLRGQYRRHMFIKTSGITTFVRMLTRWEDSQARFGLPSTIKIIVDVDPDDMM